MPFRETHIPEFSCCMFYVRHFKSVYQGRPGFCLKLQSIRSCVYVMRAKVNLIFKKKIKPFLLLRLC